MINYGYEINKKYKIHAPSIPRTFTGEGREAHKEEVGTFTLFVVCMKIRPIFNK
jgi:hypothetical protein